MEYNKIISIAPNWQGYISPIIDKTAAYKESLQISAINDNILIDLPWSSEVKNGSIAIHYIQGPIYYRSYWRFSSAEFIEDIAAVENNDSFVAHLLIIESPGGETFGIHEAHQAIMSCKKPVYAFIDRIGASAAMWIASAAKKIYVSSQFSQVGSIGAMSVLIDDSKSWEEHGIVVKEIYATKSTNKNKVTKDALEDKPDALITRFLDPIVDTMISDINAKRKLDETSEVFTGEMYYAPEAKELGLIDGIMSLSEVLNKIKPNKSTIDINKII